jgi:hypothetical protein
MIKLCNLEIISLPEEKIEAKGIETNETHFTFTEMNHIIGDWF